MCKAPLGKLGAGLTPSPHCNFPYRRIGIRNFMKGREVPPRKPRHPRALRGFNNRMLHVE